ncbi:hypothetical protein TSUD_162520 [Trifolium subterraneum]|uniref:Uncharacterized protein n=1 Tax=Trifolium subterraneum TaxID=3900 RepID=A0A2Z6NGX3_TRISU|nr:hypothetical protein TSUD_162520 [Trifolium subterraneum]
MMKIVTNHMDNLQAQSDMVHKRKKYHKDKAGSSVDGRKISLDPKAGVFWDEDIVTNHGDNLLSPHPTAPHHTHIFYPPKVLFCPR